MFSKTREKGTVITKAIESLNELTTHYQTINDPVTIVLSVPWVEYYGGITGVIDLTSPFSTSTSILGEHPFINALKAMNLPVFSHSKDNVETTKYRISFQSYDLHLIEQLPKKCQEWIEADLSRTQGMLL